MTAIGTFLPRLPLVASSWMNSWLFNGLPSLRSFRGFSAGLAAEVSGSKMVMW